MDWPRVCSLLAHELRSPSAVIAGYARMLNEGRLAGEDRAQAYAQIERAASRITTISRQASDISRWLAPMPVTASPLLCSALMTEAISRCAAPDRVTTEQSQASAALWIPVFDAHALAGALAAAIDAVLREVPDDSIAVVARTHDSAPSCDILIGPSAALSKVMSPTEAVGLTDWSVDRSGMGLALVLCAAIVMAHGGQIHTLDGRRDLLSVHLTRQSEES